jgi:hypothetical protein
VNIKNIMVPHNGTPHVSFFSFAASSVLVFLSFVFFFSLFFPVCISLPLLQPFPLLHSHLPFFPVLIALSLDHQYLYEPGYSVILQSHI